MIDIETTYVGARRLGLRATLAQNPVAEMAPRMMIATYIKSEVYV